MNNVSLGQLQDLLLHKVADREAEPLEQLILESSETADLLETATYDLIDDYVANRLSLDDAARVRKYLLTTVEGRRQAVIGQALRQYGAKAPEGRTFFRTSTRRWRSVGIATAAGLFAAAVFYVKEHPLPNRSSAAVLRDAEVAATVPPASGVAQAPLASAGRVFIVALLSERSRGGEPAPIRIPADVALVRLQCEVSGFTRSAAFQMTLTDTAGRPVSPTTLARSQKAGAIEFVEMEVDRQTLRPGAYRVMLSPASDPASTRVDQRFTVLP